jgi:hypothetical protein
MKVTCLKSQESLFETRILRRMADPVFLPPAKLMEAQGSPLLLFGKWYEGGFSEGLVWLSSVAYRLKFPCLIFPPFEEIPIGQILGLQVQLEVRTLNQNNLLIQGKEMTLFSGKSNLKVQSDYGFVGPAGKPLVMDIEGKISVVLALEPISTATALVLCGTRVFSSSGLSDDEDRQALFNGLIAWANARQARASQLRDQESKTVELTTEKLQTICVLLAGTRANTPKDIIALADSIFGTNFSFEEIEAGLSYLSQTGLITTKDGTVTIQFEPLEHYIQEAGLWPHVRMLKHDFAKKT